MWCAGEEATEHERKKGKQKRNLIPATFFALLQEGTVTVDLTVPATLDTLTSPVDEGDVFGLVQCPDVLLFDRCFGNVAASEL
jgi:hypothetical protein